MHMHAWVMLVQHNTQHSTTQHSAVQQEHVIVVCKVGLGATNSHAWINGPGAHAHMGTVTHMPSLAHLASLLLKLKFKFEFNAGPSCGGPWSGTFNGNGGPQVQGQGEGGLDLPYLDLGTISK